MFFLEQAAEQAALDQFSHYLQQEQQKLQLQQRLQRESDFSYTIPTPVANPEFAIAPPDPRYYQQGNYFRENYNLAYSTQQQSMGCQGIEIR